MTLLFKKSTENTTEELIEECRKQKAWAQQALYEKLAPKMLGLCKRYIKEPNLAEEVMIGGFVKVFQKIDQFKNEGSPEGWIKKIMVNESLGWLRKNKTMWLEVEIDERDRSEYALPENLDLEVEALLELVHSLPLGYRTVFNMYAIEGYSHKEISEQLGISENTSKSQLSRARAILQKKVVELELCPKAKSEY